MLAGASTNRYLTLTLTADEQVTRAVMMEEANGAATELRSRFAEFAVDPSSSEWYQQVEVKKGADEVYMETWETPTWPINTARAPTLTLPERPT